MCTEMFEKEDITQTKNYDFIIEQISKIEKEHNFQKEDFEMKLK